MWDGKRSDIFIICFISWTRIPYFRCSIALNETHVLNNRNKLLIFSLKSEILQYKPRASDCLIMDATRKIYYIKRGNPSIWWRCFCTMSGRCRCMLMLFTSKDNFNMFFRFLSFSLSPSFVAVFRTKKPIFHTTTKTLFICLFCISQRRKCSPNRSLTW